MNLELKIEDFEYHNIHFPPNTLSFYGFKFKPQITDLPTIQLLLLSLLSPLQIQITIITRLFST